MDRDGPYDGMLLVDALHISVPTRFAELPDFRYCPLHKNVHIRKIDDWLIEANERRRLRRDLEEKGADSAEVAEGKPRVVAMPSAGQARLECQASEDVGATSSPASNQPHTEAKENINIDQARQVPPKPSKGKSKNAQAQQGKGQKRGKTNAPWTAEYTQGGNRSGNARLASMQYGDSQSSSATSSVNHSYVGHQHAATSIASTRDLPRSGDTARTTAMRASHATSSPGHQESGCSGMRQEFAHLSRMHDEVPLQLHRELPQNSVAAAGHRFNGGHQGSGYTGMRQDLVRPAQMPEGHPLSNAAASGHPFNMDDQLSRHAGVRQELPRSAHNYEGQSLSNVGRQNDADHHVPGFSGMGHEFARPAQMHGVSHPSSGSAAGYQFNVGHCGSRSSTIAQDFGCSAHMHEGQPVSNAPLAGNLFNVACQASACTGMGRELPHSAQMRGELPRSNAGCQFNAGHFGSGVAGMGREFVGSSQIHEGLPLSNDDAARHLFNEGHGCSGGLGIGQELPRAFQTYGEQSPNNFASVGNRFTACQPASSCTGMGRAFPQAALMHNEQLPSNVTAAGCQSYPCNQVAGYTGMGRDLPQSAQIHRAGLMPTNDVVTGQHLNSGYPGYGHGGRGMEGSRPQGTASPASCAHTPSAVSHDGLGHGNPTVARSGFGSLESSGGHAHGALNGLPQNLPPNHTHSRTESSNWQRQLMPQSHMPQPAFMQANQPSQDTLRCRTQPEQTSGQAVGHVYDDDCLASMLLSQFQPLEYGVRDGRGVDDLDFGAYCDDLPAVSYNNC